MNMTDKEFKNEIRKGLCGGYLLYGDEEYLKKFYVKEAVKSIAPDDDAFSAFNLVTIDDDSYSSAALIDALSVMPMMADKVCVVCNVKLSSLKEKEKSEFLETIAKLKDFEHAVLLVVCPSGFFDAGNVKKNKSSALYKSVTKYLTPVEFPYGTPAVLKKWVLRHFERENLTADDRTLTYIVEAAGPDMLFLGTEIDKLICYTKSKGLTNVELDFARMLCSDNGESEAFALTNAIIAGDRAGALEVIKESKEKKLKATAVLSKISSDFTNMLTVAVYMKEGLTKGEIASKTGLHEFRVSRYMDAARATDVGAIRAALDRCREADVALKTSSVSDYIALERLVCTMPAKKQINRYR